MISRWSLNINNCFSRLFDLTDLCSTKRMSADCFEPSLPSFILFRKRLEGKKEFRDFLWTFQKSRITWLQNAFLFDVRKSFTFYRFGKKKKESSGRHFIPLFIWRDFDFSVGDFLVSADIFCASCVGRGWKNPSREFLTFSLAFVLAFFFFFVTACAISRISIPSKKWERGNFAN